MECARVFTRIGLRIGVCSAILLAVLLLVSTLFWAAPASSAEEYVYYGGIPGSIHSLTPVRELHGAIDPTAGWRLEWEADSALVSVIAFKDNTDVKVYTLPDRKLESQVTLDAMGKHFVELPNGTMFKVVTSKLASVMLVLADMPNETTFEGPRPATFYTATDGSYVGKEFIFVASQTLDDVPYRILALEDSEITVYKEDGSTFRSFSLKANEYETLAFSAFKGYRVVSTGSITIQTGGLGWGTERSFFVPAVEGGFMGKTFYTIGPTPGTEDWDPIEDCGWRISALEDAKVTVWNVEFKRVMEELEVNGGVGAGIYPNADELMIESDKPVSVMFVHNGSIARAYSWCYGSGVTFMGVRPNEETPFFAATNATVYTYVFAYEDSTVTIDDVEMVIKADEYFLTTVPGNHKIVSDKSLCVEIMHWPLFPPGQGLTGFGAIIPCMQTMDVTPTVTLTPLVVAESFPTTYVIAGAAGAVVIAVVGFLAVKRRGKR